jgi:hypothetical protein
VLITVAKAAQVLGLKSRGSIYRKVKSGELETTTGPDGAPWIERDGLEERWQQMTREQKNSPKPLRPATERVKPTPTRTVRVAESDVPDYNEERARHEREKRMLAELARQEKERELLRRDDVIQAWAAAVAMTRTKLLGVPSVVRARIPHLEIDEVEVITQLIREALEELAAGEVQA